MRQPSIKMCWYIAILVMLSLATSYTRADADTNICERQHIFNVLSSLESNIKEWEANSDYKTDQLHKLGQKFAEILGTIEDCPLELKEKFQPTLTLGINLLIKDFIPAEEALKLVPDDESLAIIMSLVCRIKAIEVVDFAKHLQHPTSKVRVYKMLAFLLSLTNVNNKSLVTTVPFVKDLNTIANEETNDDVLLEVKNALREAILTDFRLRHENTDEFYKINHDLTSTIVHDLIQQGIIHQEDCNEDDKEPLRLYDFLKMSSNYSTFVYHLELIFNELKKKDKLKTINSLIFLSYYEDIEDSDDAEDYKEKEHWLSIVNQFPEMAKDIYSGIICNKTVDGAKTYKLFHTSSKNGTDIFKFESSDTGTKSLLTATLNEEDAVLVLVLDRVATTDHKFDFPVEIQHGSFAELSGEASSEATSYECHPSKDILEQTSMTSYNKYNMPDYCHMKKVIEGLLNGF